VLIYAEPERNDELPDTQDETTTTQDTANGGESGAFDLGQSIGEFRDLLPEALLPYWDALDRFPVIGAALIALAGYLVAWLAILLMRHGLRQVARRTATGVDDELIRRLSRPVFTTLFFLALALAIGSLGLGRGVTDGLVAILATLVIVVWLSALLPVTRLLLETAGRQRFPLVESRTIPLFNILAAIMLIGVGAYALLMVWGINPAAWLASAGVIGIAVGFAARDTLANLFSGIFIVADGPYQIGDYVNLDTGERGRVTHVGLRSTRIMTRDDVEITVPNAVIANAKIVNESGGPSPRSRIRIGVGVAYGSDVDRVVEVLEQAAAEHDGVCAEPSPRVRMRAFGAFSLDFELLCWIDEPAARGLVSHELFMDIYKRFEAAGIQIPFPQRDLHLRTLPDNARGLTD